MSALRTLGKTLFATPSDKTYRAALWNSLEGPTRKEWRDRTFPQGLQTSGRIGAARFNYPVESHASLLEALTSIHPSIPPLEFLEGATQAVPNAPFPHLALAELLIDKSRHLDAVRHLKRARTQVHRDSNLTALFKKSEGSAATAALRAQQAKTLVPTTNPAKHISVGALLPPQTDTATLSSMGNPRPAPAAAETTP